MRLNVSEKTETTSSGEDKKIKILVLSDHPLSPSGVGMQTRYMIEGMLKTGKFKFLCLGGAIKHQDYTPSRVEGFGDDWTIIPVDGYGNQEQIRSLLTMEKPDILWFMTDPRFFTWLWEMEDEVRVNVPMVYYHVWDNLPYPTFNQPFYQSNDVVVCISKLTHDILKNVAPDTESHYLPHSVDTEVFHKIDEDMVAKVKEEHYSTPNETYKDRFTFFWNNRNARRKQSGSILFWFKDFLNVVGRENARLVMHTDIKDPHGQDLEAIVHKLGMTDGEVMFSQAKLPTSHLSMMYNMADCVINVADAEGFGLATFEGLACEKPIIVTMTGGLQEQVTDGKEFFGVGIEPASKAIIGSQEIPWIYEDRVSGKDVVDAMLKIYNMSKEDRDELGRKGRAHVMKNYNFENYINGWEKILTDVHEKMGSWETRKGYQPWHFIKIGAGA